MIIEDLKKEAMEFGGVRVRLADNTVSDLILGCPWDQFMQNYFDRNQVVVPNVVIERSFVLTLTRIFPGTAQQPVDKIVQLHVVPKEEKPASSVPAAEAPTLDSEISIDSI